MWHKPCRTFNPWCLCIKTRCLSLVWEQAFTKPCWLIVSWTIRYKHQWTVTKGHNELTHWGWDKMAAFSQTTLSNAFSWMKILEFRLKIHWSLFLRVSLSEPMMVSLLTHICVTRPKWVNSLSTNRIVDQIDRNNPISAWAGLTLNMLNCFKDYKRYIRILNHILDLAWPK